MKIKLKISRIAFERQKVMPNEILRLYSLPDRFLATEMLRLSRKVLARIDDAGVKLDVGYNAFYLRDVIPFLAKKLGAKIDKNEATDPDLYLMSDVDLRKCVASTLANTSAFHLKIPDIGILLDPVEILFNSPIQGNPVSFALDRIVPPTPDHQDQLAREIIEISNNRNIEVSPAWSPRFLEPSEKSIIELIPDDEEPIHDTPRPYL